MVTIFTITTIIILLYLLYPLWLLCISPDNHDEKEEQFKIDKVSVILLTYNGKAFLNQKINFLLKELSYFDNNELIVIDDCSLDGSIELLNNLDLTNNTKLLINQKHRGIPYSMNHAISTAEFDIIVFCDQRQDLTEGILKKIVEPLRFHGMGAVSACISKHDKGNKFSYTRMHENFLKSKESKTGSLMGVYGPLYAIKKSCYVEIPETIILDDLYLSLKILKNKQIAIKEDCLVIDESFTVLYDYSRTRRYLSGLMQILTERSVINELNFKQIIMLIWHKYLRLTIPFLLFSCYLSLSMSFKGIFALSLILCLGSLGILFAILPAKFSIQHRLRCLLRINFFYLIALPDILFFRALSSLTSLFKQTVK